MLIRSIKGPEWSGLFLDALYAQSEYKEPVMSPAYSDSDTALSTLLPQYTPTLAATLAPLYEKVHEVIPEVEWAVHAPYIAAIREWKQKRHAVILAHNYQTPEIFHGVADLTGDSLALAREAAKTDAGVIVLCGVHFMAETAKLINPEKTVLI